MMNSPGILNAQVYSTQKFFSLTPLNIEELQELASRINKNKKKQNLWREKIIRAKSLAWLGDKILAYHVGMHMFMWAPNNMSCGDLTQLEPKYLSNARYGHFRCYLKLFIIVNVLGLEIFLCMRQMQAPWA